MLQVLAFALLCLIWGSTWLVIKVGYGGLGPLNVAALRFLLAGAVLVPVTLALRQRWPRGAKEWRLVVLVAVFLFALDYGLIYWAETRIDSSLTAILFAVNPVTTALVAHLVLPGERATARKLGGALVAFLGVAALFADRVRFDPDDALPMLAVVGAALAGSIGSAFTKRDGGGLHPAALNAPTMLLGGVLLAAAALATGEGLALPREAGAWGALVYLALAGSVVTFLVYFWLMKTWTVTTLSFIAVFTPLVALVLGYVVLGEQPTVWTFVGTALILGGVAWALAPRAKRVH